MTEYLPNSFFQKVTDALEALKDRANHIGTQIASTISDFSSAVDARITAQKGQNSGVASLGSDGKIPSSQLPAIAITSTSVVANQSAQLALTAQEGDVAVRSDQHKSYIHNGGTAGTMADWTELQTPTDSVLSVNGNTGAVTLTTSDIAEGTNQYFTGARARVAAQAYSGGTQKLGSFPIFKEATVSGGNIVVHLTDNEASNGNALFPNGPDLKSLTAQCFDGTNPTFGTPVLSNSNKTLTIPITKLAPVLAVLTLGQAATGSVVKLTIWGN